MDIGVLGQGITAKSVISQLPLLGHRLVPVEEADLVVASPGISPSDYPSLQANIISEIEFAYLELQKRKNCPHLIAITGTNGKSTVTALIGHILGVPACGNIGIPLIEYAQTESPYLSVELSSYQLERCFDFTPEVGILMNLTPDHLTRHKTMEAYAEAKMRVFQNQKPEHLCIIEANNPYLEPFLDSVKSQKKFLSPTHPDLAYLEPLNLGGDHLKCNYLAAFWAARYFELSPEAIIEKMKTYTPLPHRMEVVLNHEGRLFVNDSKATNPESSMAAITSYRVPIHLIMCGDDKGLEMDWFLDETAKRVATLTVFGGIADRIESFMSEHHPTLTLAKKKSLGEAIDQAYSFSEGESVILLSPSSSSFDCFKNFEDRGNQFREWVTSKYANQ